MPFRCHSFNSFVIQEWRECVFPRPEGRADPVVCEGIWYCCLFTELVTSSWNFYLSCLVEWKRGVDESSHIFSSEEIFFFSFKFEFLIVFHTDIFFLWSRWYISVGQDLVKFSSLRLSNTYICHLIRSSVVQIMACCLFIGTIFWTKASLLWTYGNIFKYKLKQNRIVFIKENEQ